jgi:hypothetical protein
MDQPVSLEMPFKSGPRQRYQSVAEAAADKPIQAPTASQRTLRFRPPLSNAEDTEQMLLSAFLCAAPCVLCVKIFAFKLPKSDADS